MPPKSCGVVVFSLTPYAQPPLNLMPARPHIYCIGYTPFNHRLHCYSMQLAPAAVWRQATNRSIKRCYSHSPAAINIPKNCPHFPSFRSTLMVASTCRGPSLFRTQARHYAADSGEGKTPVGGRDENGITSNGTGLEQDAEKNDCVQLISEHIVDPRTVSAQKTHSCCN